MEEDAVPLEPQEPEAPQMEANIGTEDGQGQKAATSDTADNVVSRPPSEALQNVEAATVHKDTIFDRTMPDPDGEGQEVDSVPVGSVDELGSAAQEQQRAELADENGAVATDSVVNDRNSLGEGMQAADGSIENANGQKLSEEETGEATSEEALAPELVAEAADEGSIPLEAALNHLPEDGSMPFLEQRLQAAGQLSEDPATSEEEGRANTPPAVMADVPEGSGSIDAQGEGEAGPAVSQSLEELLAEECRRRQVAEAQVDSLKKQLEEATAAATQAQEQAETEAATRRELEDMMVLIEKHFKESQAARRAAEEGLDEARRAMQAYADKWEHLEQENQRLAHAEEAATRVSGVQAAVAALETERAELAAEKDDAEKALGAAQAENKRLASAVNKAEEAAKNAEQIARMKAEAEQHAVMLKMGAEIERLRLELEGRTRTMHVEMEKWRGQAEAAATSIREAKNEVLDRKRELDMTKEKMDALVEKLYIGREIDMELRGAIDYSLQRSQHLRMTDQAAYRAQGAQPMSALQPAAAAIAHAGRAQGGAGAGSGQPPGRKALPGALQTSGGGSVKLPAISPGHGKSHSELSSQDKGRGRKAAPGDEGPGDDSGSPVSSSGGYARMYDGHAQHKQAVLSRAKGEGKPATSGSPKKGEKGVDRFAETKRIQMMVSHSNRWP